MTATLKKIAGVYHVPVTTRNGRKFISTRCTDKRAAEAVVKESGIEKLDVAAKAGALTQKAIGQILTGRHLTCAKALERYRAAQSISRSPHTIANNCAAVQQWITKAKAEAMAPSAITPEHISKWINDPELSWKRSTRMVALSSLRSFFEFCGYQGWIFTDPSRLVQLDYAVMSHDQKESQERQPFTDEEVGRITDSLFGACFLGKDKPLRDKADCLFWLVAVSISKETGLRLSDVSQLEWRSFESPGKLVVWTDKTNKRIEHTISDGTRNLVCEVPAKSPTYVFPYQAEVIRDTKRRATLSTQFARLCKRCGVEGKSFHCLRHQFATRQYAEVDKEQLAKKLAESLSLDQIASLLGHSDTKVTKGYLHS